jgi:hypothetical protein
LLVPKKYDAVGSCIYCGVVLPLSQLTDEHIIPMNIGGNLILQKASCRKCAEITGKIDDKCAKTFFKLARDHLHIPGRRRLKRRRKFIRTEIAYLTHSVIEAIPIEEHPGMVMIFTLPPPRYLVGWPPSQSDEIEWARLVPLHLTLDHETRGSRHWNKPIVLGRDFRGVVYVRLLAKIAHSYAVAELGLNAFKPFLNNLILGIPPLSPCHFVGGNPNEGPPTGKLPASGIERHEIGIIPASDALHGCTITPPRDPRALEKLVVVRIRLFGDFGAPIHYVVVGERIPQGLPSGMIDLLSLVQYQQSPRAKLAPITLTNPRLTNKVLP